jgi:C4-dicarboxylate-specific signal transduction histidine kinase
MTSREKSAPATRLTASALNHTDGMSVGSAAGRRQIEMERVLRRQELGELAAGLAHEINQPLAAIMYTLSGAVRRARGGELNNAQMLDVLQAAIAHTHRASEIVTRVRGLLTQQAPPKAGVCLNEVARGMLELSRLGDEMSDESKTHPVRLLQELAPELPPVLGDRVQLEQVALNLLTNAIHAARQTPQREGRVLVCTVSDGQTVELSVWDNGPGLKPADRQRMFEPFFTTKPEGIGLGLAICQTIVEDHGGSIRAEPTVEGGLRLWLRLPVASGEPQ